MAAEWFYAKNKQKVGPVTETQLQELARTGELGPGDMVWRQGMAKWIQAEQVEGLFESGPSQAGPPPLPQEPPPVPVAEWYVIKDGKQQGPVTVEQLMAMATSSHLVWKAGMQQWVAGSTVPGLFATASPSKPILPPPPGVPKSSANITELMKTGRQKNARGEYQLAIDAFTEVIRLDPSNADAYFGRGDAYYGIAYRTNDYRAAMADFLEALRLNPGHEDAKLYLQEAQKRHQDPSLIPEVGISDPSVARQVAQKKTAAQWHAKPVETRTLSEPEHTVFSGDGPCPKCKTLIGSSGRTLRLRWRVLTAPSASIIMRHTPSWRRTNPKTTTRPMKPWWRLRRWMFLIGRKRFWRGTTQRARKSSLPRQRTNPPHQRSRQARTPKDHSPQYRNRIGRLWQQLLLWKRKSEKRATGSIATSSNVNFKS